MERPRKQRKLTGKVPTPLALLVDARVQVCLRVICRKWGLTELHFIFASVLVFLGPPPRTIADVSKSKCDLATLKRIIALDRFEPADSILTCPGFRLWQFNEGVKNAVTADNLEMAKVLLESFPDLKVSFGAVNLAAANGRIQILDLLFGRNATTVALAESQVDAGEGVENDEARADFEKSYLLVGSALARGHLELAKWLAPRVNKVASATWSMAAIRRESLPAVKWVYNLESGSDGISSGAIDAAVKVGNVEMVRWLLERYEGFVDMARVVPCGHYDTIEWLLSVRRSRCFGQGMALVVAAGHGRLDIVRLLLYYDPASGTLGAMDAAAGHCRLELVQWLHDNRTDGCTTAAMDAAAGNGHLEMVKWLHTHRTEGCTANAMDSAAVSGHLEVVEWLHANRVEGCTTQAVDGAAKNGHVEIVKWLLKNRSEGCSLRAINSAAAEGHLEIVQWLTNYGKTCTADAMDGAAGNGHLHVVKWLHANRSEGCTTQAMDEAAKNGYLDIVQWLHRNRTEGCSDAAMDLAVRYGHLAVVRWLHSNLVPTNVKVPALVGALGRSRFEVVEFVSLECSGDLVQALSYLPQSRLEFLNWMYSRYPSDFVTAFLERFNRGSPGRGCARSPERKTGGTSLVLQLWAAVVYALSV